VDRPPSALSFATSSFLPATQGQRSNAQLRERFKEIYLSTHCLPYALQPLSLDKVLPSLMSAEVIAAIATAVGYWNTVKATWQTVREIERWLDIGKPHETIADLISSSIEELKHSIDEGSEKVIAKIEKDQMEKLVTQLSNLRDLLQTEILTNKDHLVQYALEVHVSTDYAKNRLFEGQPQWFMPYCVGNSLLQFTKASIGQVQSSFLGDLRLELLECQREFKRLLEGQAQDIFVAETRVIGILERNSPFVTNVKYSPCGSFLAIGTGNGLYVWDMSDSEGLASTLNQSFFGGLTPLILEYDVLGGQIVTSLDFNADGTLLAATLQPYNEKLRPDNFWLFDKFDNAVLKIWSFDEIKKKVAVGAVQSNVKPLVVWEEQCGSITFTHDPLVFYCINSGGDWQMSNRILCECTINLPRREITTKEHDSIFRSVEVCCFDVSKDGNVVVLGLEVVDTKSQESIAVIQIWGREERKILGTFKFKGGKDSTINSIRFDQEKGIIIAGVICDITSAVWVIGSSTRDSNILWGECADRVLSIDIRPDDTLVVIANKNSNLALVRSVSGAHLKHVCTFNWDGWRLAMINSVKFSPDGETLALGGVDSDGKGITQLWRVGPRSFLLEVEQLPGP
jgi:WD40 repeat protein